MNRARTIPPRKARRILGLPRWKASPKSATCGKRAYPSYEKAVHAALLASRKCGRPLRIYRCPDCRTFHLTKLTHWEDR